MEKVTLVFGQLVWLVGSEVIWRTFGSTTVTVWLQGVLVLVQASTATQVRVASKPPPQWPIVLVVVPVMLMVMFVPPLSVAVGTSKVQAVPICTVLFGLLVQLRTGAAV